MEGQQYTPEQLAQIQQFLAQQQQQQQQPGMGMPGANQGMTPEQKMMAGNPEAFRDYKGEGAIIDDQQAKAEALRGAPTPQARNLGGGSIQAANPLEHLAAAGKQAMGNYQAKAALDEKKALSALTTKTQQDVAKELRDRQQAASGMSA